MRRTAILIIVLLLAVLPSIAPKGDRSVNLTLNLRAQVQEAGPEGTWREVDHKRMIPGNEVAIIICDMWDKHWCKSATNRCEALAKKMEPVLESARKKGVLIVHA